MQPSGERLNQTLHIAILFLFVAWAASAVGATAAPDFAFDGEWIDVIKPGYPRALDLNFTMPGDVVTYNYTLEGGHTYHIYLIGEYANLTRHLTDYDIFLYQETEDEPLFLSSHTEAAGYPEQVSNDTKGQYFTPSESGNYYVTVRNDPYESETAENATLMVVEHIEPNRWYTRFLREPIEDEFLYDSDWVYEFESSARRLKIIIEVPDTLDMYEARLYVMANPAEEKGRKIMGVMAPWESGLYANRSGIYGGFNNDPQGFRHLNASASCEHSGDDMLIDYRQRIKDPLLYHLLLMSEYCNGTLRFMIQTDFKAPIITDAGSPVDIEGSSDAVVRCRIEDDSEINQMDLYYSVDGGKTWSMAPFTSKADMYNGTIPGQDGGTVIDYYWEAMDVMGNTAKLSGSVGVRTSSSLSVAIDKPKILGGETVTLTGELSQPGKVKVKYRLGDKVTGFDLTTDDAGAFTHVFMPNQLGGWTAEAVFAGDLSYRPATSNKETFKVERKPTSLTLNLSANEIGLGSSVNLTGAFSEARVGYEVYIYARCGVNQTTLLALTMSDGTYLTVFTPLLSGDWSLQAEVKPDGIYTAGSRSTFEHLEVGGPTLAKRMDDLQTTMFKPPYVYGVGAALGGSIGGGLYLARKRGYLGGKGKEVEEVPEGEGEEDEDFDFDF